MKGSKCGLIRIKEEDGTLETAAGNKKAANLRGRLFRLPKNQIT
jgi:hypothetical protein